MSPRHSKPIFALAILLLVAAGLYLYSSIELEVWKRDASLASPLSVATVTDGVLTLQDGRALRPAGIRRLDSVTPAEYDHALRVIAAQGIQVTRDLGDGRAFLLAEPRFYNWCGTRNYEGNPWKRWAGSFIQCPVSELLVQSGYAAAEPNQPGLTAREQWRLEGTSHAFPVIESPPRRISDSLNALRYDTNEARLNTYDDFLELMWKPPPTSQ